MNAATRLGVALRRLGTLTAIGRVRVEQAQRVDLNGGDVSDLNARLAERARVAELDVLHVEKVILN